MRNQKKIKNIVREMFSKSLSSGYVDTKKVKAVLGEILSQKPVQLLKILKLYKRLIATALASEEVIVEMAWHKLPNQAQFEKTLLLKTGARRVRLKVNPKIIFGTKVTHGDWIYDATLEAKLSQLTKA